MQLNEFNQTPLKRINKINKMLSEQFGITVKPGSSKSQLIKLRESAEQALITMRNSSKKFHLDPDYAKFLGIRDIADTVLEGEMYAQSPAYEGMCNHVQETVRELMDSGYTADEAASECMNRYRRDNRYAYDDEFVLPIVLTAAKDYVKEYGGSAEQQLDEISGQSVAKPSAQVTRCIAKECGIKMQSGVSAIDNIERQLNMFSKVSGKPRDAVVNFLNELDEDSMIEGVKMFGRKISETNAFIAARRDAIKKGKKEFEINGETYPVTGADKQEVKSIKESAVKENKRAIKGSVNEWFFYDKDHNDYQDDVEAVASAIFYRLRVSHQDEIKSVPTSEVQRAVFDAAERHAEGGIDELGSSDVSILVDEVLGDLGLKESSMQENYLSLDDMMIAEDVDVEQAEVVMAVRALSSDLQDQIERLGRMVNEDLPPIADQIKAEMGADTARQFYDRVSELVNTQLEHAREAKDGMDEAIGTLTGEEESLGLAGNDDMPDMDFDSMDTEEPADDLDLDLDDLDEPAGEEEPLGRSAV